MAPPGTEGHFGMMKNYTVLKGEQEYNFEIEPDNSGYLVKLGKTTHQFKVIYQSQTHWTLLVDDSQVLQVDALFKQDNCQLNIRNIPYHLEVFDPKRRMVSQADSAGSGGLIQAPMPGKIVEVLVESGTQVEKGQPLVVIEAMKMQNELPAPLTGVVQEVTVKAGDAVEADQKLVMVAPE